MEARVLGHRFSRPLAADRQVIAAFSIIVSSQPNTCETTPHPRCSALRQSVELSDAQFHMNSESAPLHPIVLASETIIVGRADFIELITQFLDPKNSGAVQINY